MKEMTISLNTCNRDGATIHNDSSEDYRMNYFGKWKDSMESRASNQGKRFATIGTSQDSQYQRTCQSNSNGDSTSIVHENHQHLQHNQNNQRIQNKQHKQSHDSRKVQVSLSKVLQSNQFGSSTSNNKYSLQVSKSSNESQQQSSSSFVDSKQGSKSSIDNASYIYHSTQSPNEYIIPSRRAKGHFIVVKEKKSEESIHSNENDFITYVNQSSSSTTKGIHYRKSSTAFQSMDDKINGKKVSPKYKHSQKYFPPNTPALHSTGTNNDKSDISSFYNSISSHSNEYSSGYDIHSSREISNLYSLKDQDMKSMSKPPSHQDCHPLKQSINAYKKKRQYGLDMMIHDSIHSQYPFSRRASEPQLTKNRSLNPIYTDIMNYNQSKMSSQHRNFLHLNTSHSHSRLLNSSSPTSNNSEPHFKHLRLKENNKPLQRYSDVFPMKSKKDFITLHPQILPPTRESTVELRHIGNTYPSKSNDTRKLKLEYWDREAYYHLFKNISLRNDLKKQPMSSRGNNSLNDKRTKYFEGKKEDRSKSTKGKLYFQTRKNSNDREEWLKFPPDYTKNSQQILLHIEAQQVNIHSTTISQSARGHQKFGYSNGGPSLERSYSLSILEGQKSNWENHEIHSLKRRSKYSTQKIIDEDFCAWKISPTNFSHDVFPKDLGPKLSSELDT